MVRDRYVNVRLSNDELRMIDELAKVLKTDSRAEVIRIAVKKLWLEIFARQSN